MLCDLCARPPRPSKPRNHCTGTVSPGTPTCTCVCTHVHFHTCTHMHALMHTCMFTHSLPHAFVHIPCILFHMRVCVYSHTCMCTHMHTHICTPSVLTHIYTRAHTHTLHGLPCVGASSPSVTMRSTSNIWGSPRSPFGCQGGGLHTPSELSHLFFSPVRRQHLPTTVHLPPHITVQKSTECIILPFWSWEAVSASSDFLRLPTAPGLQHHPPVLKSEAASPQSVSHFHPHVISFLPLEAS